MWSRFALHFALLLSLLLSIFFGICLAFLNVPRLNLTFQKLILENVTKHALQGVVYITRIR